MGNIGILIRLSQSKNPNAPPIIILNKSKTFIGRKSEVKIDTALQKEISKHHSTIFRHQHTNSENWIIEDNNSLNGTLVNLKKIHRVFLRINDEIVFGGGSGFNIGDLVVSTNSSDLRYKFLLHPPLITFNPKVIFTPPKDETRDNCVICFYPYLAPEILSCGHTFCLNCILEWVETCYKTRNDCVCPLCRSPFLPSEISSGEASIKGNCMIVNTVEPFLKKLGVENCKQVKGASIFRIWTEKHRKWFWKSFSKVEKNDIHLNIFLHLVKATLPFLLDASETDLVNGLVNFKGKVKPSKDENLIELILIIFAKLIPRLRFQSSTL